ncbi:uncharacterized protein LOC128335573 [Hemicordylus capensis]|uniref:uncharacterized protein LOC128335573 n=1 Tax=Hemicordylus capensis TaxID=884348 RepID=UPI0023022787|nr:uncharacterized protein LOC128335573 [Hemicordylus capensis]
MHESEGGRTGVVAAAAAPVELGVKCIIWVDEAPDGADAKFCCGNCSAPSCCSSEKDQLDQTQCPTEEGLEQAVTKGLELIVWAIPVAVFSIFAFYCAAQYYYKCCQLRAHNGILQRALLQEVLQQNRWSPPQPPPYSTDPPPSYSTEDTCPTSASSLVVEVVMIIGAEDATVPDSTPESAMETENTAQSHLARSAPQLSGAEAAHGPEPIPSALKSLVTGPYSAEDTHGTSASPPALDTPPVELEEPVPSARCSVALSHSSGGDLPPCNPEEATGPRVLNPELDNAPVLAVDIQDTVTPGPIMEPPLETEDSPSLARHVLGDL